LKKRLPAVLNILAFLSFLLLFSNKVYSTDPDSTSIGSESGQSVLFKNYSVNGTQNIEGTNTARVTGKDKGVNGVKFTNPYNNHQLNVYAGTFKGYLDGHNAKFYCIDISHFIAYYKDNNPHEYTDDGTAADEIIYKPTVQVILAKIKMKPLQCSWLFGILQMVLM
jgi:hypothetical protein